MWANVELDLEMYLNRNKKTNTLTENISEVTLKTVTKTYSQHVRFSALSANVNAG